MGISQLLSELLSSEQHRDMAVNIGLLMKVILLVFRWSVTTENQVVPLAKSKRFESVVTHCSYLCMQGVVNICECSERFTVVMQGASR